MTLIVNSLIVLATFCVMEVVAWFTHKYVMHGFLWDLHEDHHEPYEHVLQKNDAFFLIFAIPSSMLTIFGSMAGFDFRFWIGIGIAVYGLAYFFIHDLFIHQRVKVLTRTKNPYLKAIRKAHKVHHKHQGKEEGECFGMLWVPMRYFREASRK